MQPIDIILQSKLPTLAQGKVQPMSTARPSSKSSGECTDLVNKVFLKFSIFYGHIWRSQFKNEHFFNLARQGWQEALSEFDEALIDTAIDESLKLREMPPTLAQFIDCCKQLNHKHTGFYSPEPVVKANPTVAKANLRKMKLMLNMHIQ
jgi:hypothetical protein